MPPATLWGCVAALGVVLLFAVLMSVNDRIKEEEEEAAARREKEREEGEGRNR